jgi:hypothetical protein
MYTYIDATTIHIITQQQSYGSPRYQTEQESRQQRNQQQLQYQLQNSPQQQQQHPYLPQQQVFT